MRRTAVRNPASARTWRHQSDPSERAKVTFPERDGGEDATRRLLDLLQKTIEHSDDLVGGCGGQGCIVIGREAATLLYHYRTEHSDEYAGSTQGAGAEPIKMVLQARTSGARGSSAATGPGAFSPASWTGARQQLSAIFTHRLTLVCSPFLHFDTHQPLKLSPTSTMATRHQQQGRTAQPARGPRVSTLQADVFRCRGPPQVPPPPLLPGPGAPAEGIFALPKLRPPRGR